MIFHRCIVALLSFLLVYSLPVFAEVKTNHLPDEEKQSDRVIVTQDRDNSDIIDEYRLNSGDQIKIHVYREADLNLVVRLGVSGDIRYPFLGTIHVSGMTPPELEKKIAHGLANGYLVNPQVRVSIEKFRPFYINGQVVNPGSYPYEPGLTVRKAISLAGGFTPNADKNKMFLIRAGDDRNHESKVSQDRKIYPSDILVVKQSYFYVNGEVKQPGRYTYQTGITYRMAISMAGGLKERADEDKVFILHEGRGSHELQLSDVDSEVMPGDMITIKQSFF